MKMTVREFKRLIKEIAVSPAFFKETKPVNDPFEKQGLNDAFNELLNQFEKYMKNDMILSMQGSYDPKSRQFDDGAFKRIEQTITSAKSELADVIKQSVLNAWKNSRSKAGGSPNKDTAKVA